ncbi:CPBP family intramembrane metalloprotease [Flavobacteriaceae bacterium D16]|nr:CPBP family intramembrane metalloprotease [Flavobacteriaceae bacterium D16]
MNIFKAIILTALFISLELVFYLLIYQFVEPDLIGRYAVIIAQGVAYSILILIFFRGELKWINEIENLKHLNYATIFYLAIVVFGLKLFDRSFFDLSRILDFGQDLDSGFLRNSNITFAHAVGALIFAPIFEELFFRKLLFGQLREKYNLNFSILSSSILFALIHLPYFKNLIPSLILGVICCIIYVRTKNIWYPVILHFLSNLFWLILVSIGDPYNAWILGLNYNMTYWALFVLGIIIVLIGMKRITTANNGYG